MNQTQAKADKARYKDSLNLPKTSFPMKANLVQNEPASLKRWEAMDLYQQVTEDQTRSERFVFHDGPPYANGSIHLGHLLNKCLKDFVVRSKLMAGFACPYVPGWDCHGLPIEHKVMTELSSSGKLEKLATLDEDTRRTAIRRECQKYAEKHVKHQTGQMKGLLTLADYDHPYLTMNNAYEGATLEVFAGLVEQGLVYRQLKAVHWSIANETALADAELEYEEREDISVFVDFEALDGDAVYDAFGLPAHTDEEDDEDEAPKPVRPHQKPSFMIWTTTPWTLPANLAIAVNEKFTYALVKVDGSYTVLAEGLVEQATEAAGAEEVEIVATTTGDKLVGLRYRHPFVEGGPDFATQPDAAMRGSEPEGIYRVVQADYVTLEDGTGLVHTAPGHGSEDYMTGLREKLPVYCPVRGNGTYDDSVPEKYRGLSVWEANEKITADLSESGHLFHSNRFMHSYPHDWRSKTPVIFRATEQWFIGVDEPAKASGKTLRESALDDTAERVKFIPEWGRNRMRGMLESRPDWCISRQRAWGLPIPAFYAQDADGNPVTLLTTASVRAIAKAFREEGSDSWFTKDSAHLLRHYDYASDAEAPKGLDVAALAKSRDIFDVWFESGSSWNSVMRERSGGATKPLSDNDGVDYPIDLYLEGSDQHRGWFQLSLLPGLGTTGTSPFKSVLTHGFMVDKDGKKMSKSLGNALDVDELVKNFGADVCRWWIGSISYENDIKADLDFFKTAGETYRKIRNTLRFMLSNLADFKPSLKDGDGGMCVAFSEFPPTSIDAWALAEFNKLSQTVRAAYDAYQFQKASSAIYNFCNDTMSAIYLGAVKDRLYCDRADSARRRRTQSALWDICDGLCRLLAPIIPHTADEAYRELRGVTNQDKNDTTCVHAARFVDRYPVECDPAWSDVMKARDTALKAMEQVRAQGDLENPLDCAIVFPDPKGTLATFDSDDLADLLGVSRATVDASASEVRIEDLRDQPMCERSRKRDATVKQRSDGGMLSDRDAEAVGVS